MAQTPQSNTYGKGDQGAMPDPFSNMLNSLMAMLGGSSFQRGPNETVNPERTAPPTMAPQMQPPVQMPNGMEMRVPQPMGTPPVPQANPMMHPSPEQAILGQLFQQAMQPVDPNTGMSPTNSNPEFMMQNAPLPGLEQPTIAPPVPTKKTPAKPEKAKFKGGPSTEPKQVTAPPKKKTGTRS